MQSLHLILLLFPFALAAQDNLPPTVSFPPESFQRLSPFTLEVLAVCDDDGLPTDSTKESAWEVIAGSTENVTITPIHDHGGQFQFTASGEFTIRFLASDGELESSRDFFVAVGNEGITAYRSFAVPTRAYKAARQAWSVIKQTSYPNGLASPDVIGFHETDFLLNEDREVIVTLLHDGASLRNSLAWYDANDDPSSGGHLIWSDVAIGPAAPLEHGSRSSLGLLPAGTNLRFYLIQDGAGVGTTLIAQDPIYNENGKTMVAAKFNSNNPTLKYLAFEDRFNGDDSYEDLVFQIEFVPPSNEVSQLDSGSPHVETIASDRGSRGVQQLLNRENLNDPELEVRGGVFQLPADDLTYQFELLDDRSSMGFTLGVVALDQILTLSPPSLIFREQAAEDAIIIMDDRISNPGDTVTFTPGQHDLLGKRVIFFIIPNNVRDVFLRNPWRYTPRGNGNNTKRQPLFSIGEANPGRVDQFLIFTDQSKTIMTIEDLCRSDANGELGTDSDHSFDDIQISITPPLTQTDLYPAYYAKTIDYTLGYESSDGLSPSIENYDARAIMKNARGSRRWDLLFSTLVQPDGAFLTSEFGESLPIATSGALSVNIDWENGQRSDFFIEQQRYGADLIETGIILEDKNLINDGINMINWGFLQQASDGSFPSCGDAIHSTSLFLEAASRAGLALKKYKPRTYRKTIRNWRRKIHLTAHWFVVADATGRDVNLEPFGHRYFLRAAALEQASRLTRDKGLSTFADEYITEALTKAQPDGSFLENNLFDASYQMVGMAFASRYFSVARNNSLRQQVSLTIWNGIARFLQDVQPNGAITIHPDSRTATESSRGGAPKRFDYKHTTKALVFAEEGLFMTGAENAADLILQYSGELD
ncbi:MAG: DUF4114 domain-containing protein [Verrucomicrobiota bacterium]